MDKFGFTPRFQVNFTFSAEEIEIVKRLLMGKDGTVSKILKEVLMEQAKKIKP